jgi:hypothetical protein
LKDFKRLSKKDPVLSAVIKKTNSFNHPMKRYRKISLVFLSISAFIGLVRGYRMTGFPEGNSVLMPYSESVIKDSLFSNYSILGWILFFLVGVFSLITIAVLLAKKRSYPYLIMIEGIFGMFFSLTNLLLGGFSFVHLILLPFCIGLIVLGIQQTPKEF